MDIWLTPAELTESCCHYYPATSVLTCDDKGGSCVQAIPTNLAAQGVDFSLLCTMYYYIVIISVAYNGLKITIILFIAIISGTIYRPTKVVIVTGLDARSHKSVINMFYISYFDICKM